MTFPKIENYPYQYQYRTMMHLLRKKSITTDMLKNLRTEVRYCNPYEGLHNMMPTRLALHTNEGMVSLGFADDDLINKVIVDYEIEKLIENIIEGK